MNQRDVILVPFPFSDQTGTKIRPALVLSNNQYNKSSEDIVICGITSNTRQTKYSIIIKQTDIENGILYEASSIKVENILKIPKSLIIKKIATINAITFSKVIKILEELFSEN